MDAAFSKAELGGASVACGWSASETTVGGSGGGAGGDAFIATVGCKTAWALRKVPDLHHRFELTVSFSVKLHHCTGDARFALGIQKHGVDLR